MFCRPLNRKTTARMQMMIPIPSTGMKIGWLVFLNELLMTVGPMKNIGSAHAMNLKPLFNMVLSVGILERVSVRIIICDGVANAFVPH